VLKNVRRFSAISDAKSNIYSKYPDLEFGFVVFAPTIGRAASVKLCPFDLAPLQPCGSIRSQRARYTSANAQSAIAKWRARVIPYLQYLSVRLAGRAVDLIPVPTVGKRF
jgi:hypothetical protein